MLQKPSTEAALELRADDEGINALKAAICVCEHAWLQRHCNTVAGDSFRDMLQGISPS